MLYLAKELEKISLDKYTELFRLSEEISKLIGGFIKTL
jgi:hypothetical protein